MLHFLHWCCTWTALLSANQNRVIFSCKLLQTELDSPQSYYHYFSDLLQIHRSLAISAWTKGAIWNTSDSTNPAGKIRRNKRFKRFELFSEQFFHTPKTWQALCTDSKPSILDYIITQVIPAFWLILVYNLLEDRRTIDVIIKKFYPLCFKVAEPLRI